RQHFDAFVYVTNWGTKQLAFRLPHNALDPDELKAYLAFDEVSLESSAEHTILNIYFSLEDGTGEWIEGEGLIDSLVPLRDDLLRGDLRALYLVWLQAAIEYEASLYDEREIEGEEEFDDLLEPPLPPGLQQLIRPVRALIEFLEIDPDLVTAAAQA